MSELKCIYWENATPDDFINARRGETWIQGVGEVDTFYAEDLVHNFGKAWKEKLTLALVEVERLVDDLLSVSKQLGQSEARGLYDHIEPAEVAINDLKSRLLAALSNTTPYLSQDVNVERKEWTAWLIEDNHKSGSIRYMTMEQGMFNWTTDPLKALHFCRREDAEKVAQECDDAEYIREHLF